MGVIWAAIIGLVVGAIAKLLMPGRDPGGIVITALIGVGGSLAAFLIGRAAGWYSDYASGPGIVASVLGAMLLLFLYRMAMRRRLA